MTIIPPPMKIRALPGIQTFPGWNDRNRKLETSLWAELCRNSFWHFLMYGVGTGKYMETHPANKWCVESVHRPLCEWLQEKTFEWEKDREFKFMPMKLMVVWPRHAGKTHIVTKSFQLWLQLRNPDLASVTDSVTINKSWEFVHSLQSVMSGADPYAWFTKMYGNWYDPKRAWRSGFLVHKFRKSVSRSEPSIKATSVEKGLTGEHPDCLFIDDPLVQEKLKDEGTWNKTVNSHCDNVIPALQPNGILVAVGTRYLDGDWIGRYLELEGAKEVQGMPIKEFTPDPENGQWCVYFMQARDSKGNSILPTVPQFTEEFLKAYEKKNPLDFWAQMMNEPGTGSHMPITRDQLEQMWVEQNHVPNNLRISIHCDTAWKTRENLAQGDFSVIQVWGHDATGNGVVYFLEARRSNIWRVEDFGEQLVMLLQKYKRKMLWPFVITDEQALGGKADSFAQLVTNWCAQAGMFSPPVQLINRQGRKKEIRIREAAGYWVDGKVRLVRNAPEVENLCYEMLRIGTSRFDDMADAAADVFHPEIYMPEVVTGKNQSPSPRRPGDDILQLPVRLWDDDTIRDVYDEDLERRIYHLGSL